MEEQMDEILKKLKASPHWREDFRLVEVQDAGCGYTNYYIEADDQESSTALAIAKLSEMLPGTGN